MVSIDFVVVDNAKIQVFYASYDCSIDDTSGCSAHGVTDRERRNTCPRGTLVRS